MFEIIYIWKGKSISTNKMAAKSRNAKKRRDTPEVGAPITKINMVIAANIGRSNNLNTIQDLLKENLASPVERLKDARTESNWDNSDGIVEKDDNEEEGNEALDVRGEYKDTLPSEVEEEEDDDSYDTPDEVIRVSIITQRDPKSSQCKTRGSQHCKSFYSPN